MPKSTNNDDGFGFRASSLSAGVPPEINPSITRAYHLTSPEHAISSIALGRLKVSRFSDLNDPFELMAVNFRDSRVRKAAGKNRKEVDVKTGLLCFSRSWEEPVLWSHYGARHKGVCLGFEIATEDLEEVLYEDSRILDYLDRSDDPEKLPKDLKELLQKTKYSGWKYEEELRAFVALDTATNEGGLYFRPFSERLRLSEVILGPLCTLSLEAVRGLVSERWPSAITYKARLAHKTYRVVVDERSRP